MNDLRASFIQTDIYWQDIEANLGMLEEKIWQLKPTDLIVLPEMFSTGFTMEPEGLAEPMNSKTCKWMKLIAAQTNAAIIGSIIIKERSHYFNRLFVFFPNGSFQYYDKKHLFTLAGENNKYTAGNKRLIVEWRGWKIMPLICYDLRFPVWARSKNGYEYDLLVFIANWPVPRIHAWDTLLKARAIENLSYLIGVNRIGTDGYHADYIGHSVVLDYKGEELVAPSKEDCLKTCKLEMEPLKSFRTRFDFQKEADSFKLL